MRVAIIGAGLSGLACAYELEKHNISPVIFEKNSFIGEAFPHVGAALNIAVRPIKDPMEYLKAKVGLDIKPLTTVNKVIHFSPNKVSEIKGNLGYFLNRSMELDDLKVQIHSKLKKTNIIFNEYADYKKLSKDYDYVIIGNGDPSVAKELGCWTDWVNAYVKGAVVLGDFDPNTFIVWVNKDYCKNGYAYLSPFDKKRASVVLVVTDVNEKEVDHYWQLFLQTENIQYRILENYKLKHTSGIAKPHKVNNMLLVGNAGGAMDPFLGFGVLGSLLTGVMSARSIITNKDYEKLIAKIVKKNLQFYEFRKAFNDLNNSYFDILISSIGMPVIKQLIYDTSINVVNLGAHLLKIKNRVSRK